MAVPLAVRGIGRGPYKVEPCWDHNCDGILNLLRFDWLGDFDLVD